MERDNRARTKEDAGKCAKRRMACLVMAAVVLLVTVAVRQYQDSHLAEALSKKVLRFHVIANSDRAEDQALKLKVRDAVGLYMRELLQDASSLQESREIAQSHLAKIRETADAVVAREGYAYEVSVALEETQFPDKTYGPYTLPGGSYQALRVVIGEGGGQNWWCVMYPNMCFAGSVYEVPPDAAEKLCRVLTVGEYRRLIESSDRTYRFRLLSFLEEGFWDESL